jgi:uncharacterized membrane protein YfcA
MALALVLGVLVGLTMGLTGAGGGILAVPALVVGLGWTMHQATPVALMAVALGAAVGAIEGLYRRLVRYRAAALMALAGIPATALGVQVAGVVSTRRLTLLFSSVTILIGIRLLQQSGKSMPHGLPTGNAQAWCRMDPNTGRLRWSSLTATVLAIIGASTGFLAGLLGVGGGFVLVPALRRATDISMHGIIATSLLVIALVSAGAVVSALLHGAAIPANVAAPFVASTVAGMAGGRVLAHKLTPAHVQRIFALFLLAVAATLVVHVYA